MTDTPTPTNRPHRRLITVRSIYSDTSWAEHHGLAAVEQLIKDHPTACADAIREAANRWHATENLPGFLAACDRPLEEA